MKTFHIGSLPFESVSLALDFTFSFDIPTLFTLPKHNPDQLIGLDIVIGSGLGKVNSNSMDLKKLSLVEIKNFRPYYWDDFTNYYKSKNSSLSIFKYQCVGPITFHQIIKKHTNVSLEDVILFMNDFYSHLASLLSKVGQVIMVIDEPYLAQCFSQSDKLNSFFEDNRHLFSECLVHCCDFLETSQLETLVMPMSLDLDLYLKKNIKVTPCGVGVSQYFDSYLDEGLEAFKHGKYLTPSCGLAFKTEKEAEKIRDKIFDLKNRIHPI